MLHPFLVLKPFGTTIALLLTMHLEDVSRNVIEMVDLSIKGYYPVSLPNCRLDFN